MTSTTFESVVSTISSTLSFGVFISTGQNALPDFTHAKKYTNINGCLCPYTTIGFLSSPSFSSK